MNKNTYEDFMILLGDTAFSADYKTISKGKNKYSETGRDFSKSYTLKSMNNLYKEAYAHR